MQIRITIKDTTPFRSGEEVVIDAECPLEEAGTRLRQMAIDHPMWRIKATERPSGYVIFKAWRNSKGTQHFEMPERRYVEVIV